MPKQKSMQNFRVKFFTSLIFLFSSFFASGQSNVIDEVVAVVGDEPVLRSEIEFQHQQALMQGEQSGGDMRCQIFEQMMVQNLLLEQAKIDSVEVGENQVIMTVERQINEFINRAGSREKLEEWLNKSLLKIKEEQRELVRNQMLTQQVRQEITENIEVTPSEIRRFFEDSPKDSLPEMPAQYEFQKIAITPEVSQEEIDRVKGRLREFQRQIREGERDFSTLAVLYSEDENSASRGGELGLTPRSNLVPEFAKTAFNLREDDQVSKIVETEFGFHIMQLIEKQSDRVNVRHILLKPEPTDDAVKEARNLADSIVGIVRNDSISFEDAALRYSDDKDTRASGGSVINSETQSTRFELQDINPDIARVIENMDEGEVSEPFLMKDQRLGIDQYTIVRLKRKIEPHRANMVDDYQTIKKMLEEKKRQETFRKWVKKKQKETYISISENWKDCDFDFKGWVK